MVYRAIPSRQVIIPSVYGSDYSSATADQVDIAAPAYTGIVDAGGVPIYRVPEQVGFRLPKRGKP